MSKRILAIGAVGVVLVVVVLLGRMGSVEGQEEGQEQVPGAGFAAIPGQKGGQDIFGPYEAVPNWPRPMSESLPGPRELDLLGQTMDVFAESPNRVLLASARASCR